MKELINKRTQNYRTMLLGILILAFIMIFVIKILVNINQEYPDDFNFTYRYGAYGKEFIDTSNNTLKYHSVNGMIELNFKLSVDEKNEIYSKMKALNFMNIPSLFPRLLTFEITPIETAELIVEYHGEKNEVRWSTLNFNLANIENPTEGNEQLEAISEIGAFIQKIINEKLKKMDLPDKPMYL